MDCGFGDTAGALVGYTGAGGGVDDARDQWDLWAGGLVAEGRNGSGGFYWGGDYG